MAEIVVGVCSIVDQKKGLATVGWVESGIHILEMLAKLCLWFMELSRTQNDSRLMFCSPLFHKRIESS